MAMGILFKYYIYCCRLILKSSATAEIYFPNSFTAKTGPLQWLHLHNPLSSPAAIMEMCVYLLHRTGSSFVLVALPKPCHDVAECTHLHSCFLSLIRCYILIFAFSLESIPMENVKMEI